MSEEQEEKKDDPFDAADRFAEYQRGVRDAIWTTDDTGHDLTVEEALFVRSYIIDRSDVASMRRLGYTEHVSIIKRRVKKYLANPEVLGAIETLAKRMMDRLEITAEKVTRHMAMQAFFDPRSVMRWNGHRLEVLDSQFWPDEAIASIEGLKMTKDAGVEIKLASKQAALTNLAKQLNLLADPAEEERKAMAEAAATRVVDKISDMFDRIKSGGTLLEGPKPEGESPETQH